MRKITALFGILVTIVCLNILLVGIVSAQGDLDNDGIADNIDPETIISSSVSLPAGEYSFQSLTITNNAILSANSNISLSGFKGVKINAENLIVEYGSSISADGAGYPGGQGPGAGTRWYSGSRWYTSGGSYGGLGENRGGPLGPTYGLALAPTDLGSGGGSEGGGAVRIVVSDTLTLNGKITANGKINDGGSGGSVYVTANHLTGAGLFSANGAAGHLDSSWVWAYLAGGGGRIAIYYNSSTFTGNTQATGYNSGTVISVDQSQNTLISGPSFRFTESDSPYIYQTIELSGSVVTTEGNVRIHAGEFRCLNTTFTFSGNSTLTIERNGTIRNSTVSLPGNQSILTDSLTLNNSVLTLSGGNMLRVAKPLTIDNSVLTLSGENTLQVADLSLVNNARVKTLPQKKIGLNLANLAIDASSEISADGAGYPGGQGPGAGTRWYSGSRWYTSGGSYGGLGENRGGPLGPTYGLALAPTDLGSGGGSEGGGAVRIVVSDTLTLNGKITANGKINDGGSGGSVYVTANHLTGAGLFSANGAAGHLDSSWVWAYLAGGGGRIAIYYNSSTFTGNTQATGYNSGTAIISSSVVVPVANFTGIPTSGTAPLTVTFTDSSTNSPTSWSWSFGDGSSSTEKNPSHTYSNAGTYTVSLTATNSAGSNTATKIDYFTVNNVNRVPVLTAIGDKNVDEGVQLQFTVSAMDPDGDALIYTTSTLPAGAAFDTGTKTFTWIPTISQAGSYPVTFTVSDGLLSTSENVAITVINVNQNPVAEAGLPQTVIVKEPAVFDGRQSQDPDGSIASYAWNFGDGSSGSGVSPTHSFGASGTFTVTLTVTDNEGAKGTDTTTVTVKSPSQATQDVITQITSMNLPKEIESSLTSKLDNVVKSLDKGNVNAAKNQLEATINEITAQKGKKIPGDQATIIVTMLQKIILYL